MIAAIYPTKKALKASVGSPLRFVETSLFGEEYASNGNLYVVGPSSHCRKWYATVTMKDGLIEKVR